MWLSWTNQERVSPVVKEKRYIATKRIDARGSGPAGAQSFWDRGGASNQKVPEDIVPRVGSSRRFPGGFLNEGLAGGEDCGYFA